MFSCFITPLRSCYFLSVVHVQCDPTLYICFAKCSIDTLGNNISIVSRGIKFPCLLIPTLYFTLAHFCLHLLFNFSIIMLDFLLLKLRNLIFINLFVSHFHFLNYVSSHCQSIASYAWVCFSVPGICLFRCAYKFTFEMFLFLQLLHVFHSMGIPPLNLHFPVALCWRFCAVFANVLS